MDESEKTNLQNELKYYSDLLAAHYSSVKNQPQQPNFQINSTRNPPISTYSTFKTSVNHVHHYKPTSFQPRTATHFPRHSNSKIMPSFTFHKKIDLPNKSSYNSFNSKNNYFKSSTVKVNPTAFIYKSLNTAKETAKPNNLIKNPLSDIKRQTDPSNVNKASGSNSQILMDELGVLIKQLKQKSKHIDNKINFVPSKVHLVNNTILDKSELKVTTEVPVDSKTSLSAMNNINQTIDMQNTKSNISSSANSLLPSSSKNTNSCLFDGKHEFVQMNDSLEKPLKESRNSILPQLNDKTVKNAGKIENSLRLRVSMAKTPLKKKIIRKSNSVKKLNGTPLFSSKYKVVNKKLPYVEHGKKTTSLSPEIKTALKIKPVKTHINSAKKLKGGTRIITTKYKLINKKLPFAQLNPENSFQITSEGSVCKLPANDPSKRFKTNEIKMKVWLNSQYRFVNKNGKAAVMSPLLRKKSITPKKSKLGNFVYQGNKNLNKLNTNNNTSRKNVYSISRLHRERKIITNKAVPKQNHLHVLNFKRKHISQNSYVSNSRYKSVNNQSSSLKKNSETGKSIIKSNDLNSGIDIDLLMELAAERKKCSDSPITNSLSKHVLIKRVYKSKNAIVNKNICSLRIKAAKMIKTKYSILNKKHSWQKQSITQKLISPKSFKGHKFNNTYQRKAPYFHATKNNRNNSRYHGSNYYIGKSYSRRHLVSKNKSFSVGPFRSIVKTPKRFVLNRKESLKIPNTLKLNYPISKTIASRVLNRSINRVLNASVKKKTSKVNVYCMFYNRFGRCNKGIKCTFVHDPSKIAVCTRYLRGTCKTKNCPFSHEICPGKMAICSFFLLGSCTKTDCPYRHETLSPDANLCKAFVEGYCPDGKQCKQAHVLICPQFVQGKCEKGKACPFPHPPPKGKKTIPNLSEKKSSDLEEIGEPILEKMWRYFVSGNEPENNSNSSVSSIAVPRLRNLPEQPSFIAL